MCRLLALTLAVATLAGVGAGVAPEEAQALSNPQSTLLRSLSPADLKALIADIDAQGLNTSGSTNTKLGVGRIQLAAGRFGALSALSTIGLVATGSVIVWKIADGLGLGGYVYRKITGESYGGTLSGGVQWTYAGSGDYYTLHAPTNTPKWVLYRVSSNPDHCVPSGFAGCTIPAWFSTAAIALSGSSTLETTNSCGSGVAANCYAKHRSDSQMQASLQVQPSSAAEFASPPAGATTVTAGTADSTISDPELAAALDAIDPSPGTTGTAVEQETAEAILDELDPGWSVGTVITLLQPMPNETYTEYIARLQAAGWVGTATSTVLASEAEGIGPLAVARVTFPQGATVRTLSPIAWPVTAPTISPTAALTIRYNPATAAPAPTEGGTGTSVNVTVDIPPTTVPPPVGIDFSPITDLEGECSFPFGFICYAQDVTAEFDVTADAPVFDFDVTVPALAGGGTIAYTVDLDVMDDYMALMRTLISFVLWVGAVYFLAVNLLGFRAGGDPSETADEALHV